MFKKLDNYLHTMSIIINVFSGFMIAACIPAGIVMIAMEFIAGGVCILVAGPIVFILAWSFLRLIIMHFCDVKLIRNKLYDVGNETLYTFVKNNASNTVRQNDLLFEKNYDGTYSLTKYIGMEGSVSIPKKVNWITVSRIGESAFENCDFITNIDMPNGVTDIDCSAFSRCSNLENITLPDSLLYIGASAFKGCKKLKSVNFSSKTGWEYFSNDSDCVSVSAEMLSDPAIAAECLTNKYCDYDWERNND